MKYLFHLRHDNDPKSKNYEKNIILGKVIYENPVDAKPSKDPENLADCRTVDIDQSPLPPSTWREMRKVEGLGYSSAFDATFQLNWKSVETVQ